ncbi:Protein-N(5)-glutamine methyltransferase PrmC [Serinicoccus hydrothermalis]|uniref:Protein-N(5)-glutamine methyltransferase PrmC n=1 Tax=Serinicoccus hydrothermalis TaxID=1758689 RepID=A0A1B1NEY2_9MICO|nr:class I SAM-dependent methyltransferase [Serinicoccus hydrothermalis]ANS79998.1 Protein-N(5)-glutamine methyltransferase PrmC [Serinicoccus hydrothermalis]
MPQPARRPVGTVTRGTTNPNRLRRVDRWMGYALGGLLRSAPDPPVVVDLGYGASPVTVLELADRLGTVRSDVRVVGVEIDPERVRRGAPLADPPRVDFALGGFEVPLPAGLGTGVRPTVVRAFNVLRQYAEPEVAPAWAQMVGRLAPGGALVEGTCDELGRLAAWVDVRRGENGEPTPRTLTISLRLAGLDAPSVVAERLPKVLIHRNVPGERVHTFLTALDRAWERAAPLASFGARQRFVATARSLREEGWPVRGGAARWRLGELTVDWAAVAPG